MCFNLIFKVLCIDQFWPVLTGKNRVFATVRPKPVLDRTKPNPAIQQWKLYITTTYWATDRQCVKRTKPSNVAALTQHFLITQRWPPGPSAKHPAVHFALSVPLETRKCISIGPVGPHRLGMYERLSKSGNILYERVVSFHTLAICGSVCRRYE